MPIDDTSPAAQQQLKALAPAVLDTCPNMQTMAAETAREILVKHDLAALDPDRVYWHRFKAGTSDSQAFTGWVHNEKPLESMTLSQLVIHRFSLHDQDNADLLDGDGGFYSVGPDAQVFDHRNEVRLSASDVLGDFWDINFSERYSTRVDGFWSAHQDDFRTLGKVNFLAQALQARQANHLTDAQFQTVIKAVASDISWPPSLPKRLPHKACGSPRWTLAGISPAISCASSTATAGKSFMCPVRLKPFIASTHRQTCTSGCCAKPITRKTVRGS